MKSSVIFKKINHCRIEEKNSLISICKFPRMALTGIFPRERNTIPKVPVEIGFSHKSKLLQLHHNYNPKFLYGKTYGYRSGLNPIMIKHLKNKSLDIKKKIILNKKDLILDIGSNDGTFLNFFSSKCFGIDPSLHKLKKFYKKNIIKIPFTFEKGFNLIKKKKFKLITAIAMFYDIEKPNSFLAKIKKILDTNGIFHIEVAYLPDIIKKLSYDTFCQEHYEYYSLISLKYLIEKNNFKILNFGLNSVNGGSIWLDITHSNSLVKIKKNKINKQILIEKKMGIHLMSTYKKFFTKVFNHARKLKNILIKIKSNGKNISGFGASTKGNVLLNLANISDQQIDAIYDVNKDKFNKFTPGQNILIKNEKFIKNDKSDYILLLIWHFNKYIIKKIKKITKNKKIIIPFPKIRII
jgi:SAM-dependent methyltransferase